MNRHRSAKCDQRIAAIAARQRGIVTRLQLRAAGISAAAIDNRLHRHLLHPLHHGVYVWGHPVLVPGAAELAALMACGGRQVIVSHESALGLWGIPPVPQPEVVHVTAVNRKLRSRRGICVHYAAALTRTERSLRDRLPLTSPARTALDLAATGYPGLERAVSEMQAMRLVTRPALQQMLAAAPGHRGVAQLRAAVGANATGFTRSEAERRMRRLCQGARLPQPQANARVAGYEVDLLWPQHRLVVEIDGYQFHGHRAAFERDRRKQTALVAAGFTVIRVTWRQLCDEPMIVVGAIARALGRADPHGH